MADRNGYIGRAPGDSAVTVARQTFSPTGITTDFTFASGYTPGYFDIFINGAKMIEGSDYTSTDGSTFVILNGGVISGDVIEGVAYKAFNLGDARRIGIQSGGALIGNVDTLNFIGTGNTFALSGGTIDVSISGGGAGAGARVQVLDISGAGVTEVIVNVAGTGYQEGDIITFSSGTAEAKVSIVGGGFAPETGSVDIHVELESGTITGSGSGDLLLEDDTTGETTDKFLDSASQMVENEVKMELENEVGHLLSEDDGGTQTAERHYILNQEHEIDFPYGVEDNDHIVQEDKTQNDTEYTGDKLVQENTTVEQFEFELEAATTTGADTIALENEVGNLVNEVQNTDTGDITDIRMIASGSGYTTLPTATLTIGDRHLGLEDATNEQRLSFVGSLEDGSGAIRQEQLDDFGNIDNILNEDESLTTIIDLNFDFGEQSVTCTFIDSGDAINFSSSLDQKRMDTEFENDEEIKQLYKFMIKLGEKCQELFRRYMEVEGSFKEVSERMGEPLGTVQSRFHRCKLSLLKIIQNLFV